MDVTQTSESVVKQVNQPGNFVVKRSEKTLIDTSCTVLAIYTLRPLQQASGPKNRNLFLLLHIPTEFGHHCGVVVECEDEITYALHQTVSSLTMAKYCRNMSQ
jgi:hypothetical protein